MPDFDVSRAVLVGASAYRDGSLVDLPAVRSNVDGIAQVLTDQALCGFPAQSVATVIDPQTAAEVMDPVNNAATHARDLLLVYVAGHGLLTGEAAELHLAIAGSVPGQPWTSLPFRYLATVLRRASATVKMLLLDCCYSGRAGRDLMAEPTRVAVDQVSVDGVYVMTSTSSTQTAKAPVGQRYTAFTGALVDVLRNGIPSAGALLEMSTVYEAVSARLHQAGLPRPQQYHRNNAGALALVRNVGHARLVSFSATSLARTVSARELLTMSLPEAAEALERLPPTGANELAGALPVERLAAILRRTGLVFSSSRLLTLPTHQATQVLRHLDPGSATQILVKVGPQHRVGLLETLIDTDRDCAAELVRRLGTRPLSNALIFAPTNHNSRQAPQGQTPAQRLADFVKITRADGQRIVDGHWTTDEPLVARRRLGCYLRRLRESSQTTQQTLAAVLSWPISKIVRIESGDARTSTDDVHVLLNHFHVRDARLLAYLTELAQTATQRVRLLTDIPLAYAKFVALEPSVAYYRGFDPMFIPGLLQTPHMASFIIGRHFDYGSPETARRVNLRLQRQADVLNRTDPTEMEVILYQSALQSVMTNRPIAYPQLLHLIALAQRPNIRLQLAPLDSTPTALGHFQILTLTRPDEAYVYTEGALMEDLIENERRIKEFEDVFNRAQRVAMSTEETMQQLLFLTRQ